MRRPCTKLIGESPFDLGSKVGTWLIERGFSPKYKYVGIHKEGSGGLWEHAYHQGYDSKSIQDKIKSLL